MGNRFFLHCFREPCPQKHWSSAKEVTSVDLFTLFVSGIQDESGSLERPEIVRALVKSIPELSGRDESWLLGTFASIWGLIDPDGDGKRRGLL